MRRAAIFDLDGTLIPNASAERTFFFHLLRNGGLSPIDLLQMTIPLWSSRGNLHAMMLKNKRYLRHKAVEKFNQVARAYFEPQVEKMVFPQMREIIEEHRRRGDVLLLLSGTLDVIAGCFVRELFLDGAKATDLQRRDGKYTGRVQGVVPYGFGKLEVLRDFRHRYEFDQNHTTVYANIYSDRYVMNAVETPVAVNPDSRLRDYATRNAWRILDVKEGLLSRQ
jgi:HAD superfamily hydrolase (TIGR01490 family)